MWEMAPHHRRGANRQFDVIDRKHEYFCSCSASGLHHFASRGVAVIDLVAETADEIDLRYIGFKRRELDAAHAQHTRNDLSETSKARNDHAALVTFDQVVLTC